jgi:hypothetical protein
MYSLELQQKTLEKLKEFIVQSNKKIDCLAWGAVFSCIELAKEFHGSLKITAIEHNRDKSSEADRIRVSSDYADRMDIHCIESNNLFSGSGDYDSFRDYVLYPTKWKKKFDLIIINGMARKEALNISQMLLSRGGMIIITESNGENYEKYLANDLNYFVLDELGDSYHKAYFISDSAELIDRLSEEILEEEILMKKEEIIEEPVVEVIEHTPKVSVIVTTLDRYLMLEVAIKSILKQSFQDFEIIVINDGGDDVSKIKELDDRIILINHDKRRGISAARNSGLDIARGKYIAYLDDDDYYMPKHLELLAREAGRRRIRCSLY